MWCMPCRPSFPPCRAAFLPNLPCLLPAHLPAHPACLLPWLLQTERISALEAQRSQLLQQLPSGVQAHVLKRQHEAVEEEGGGAGVVLCRSACRMLRMFALVLQHSRKQCGVPRPWIIGLWRGGVGC